MRFPYDSKQRPMLPVTLQGSGSSVDAVALVDSGADVNVLPWHIGLSLGLAWNPNKATLRLAGVPDREAAMPALLSLSFGGVHGAAQAFAWCQSEAVPLVLGQTNFFLEFDVCFFRSKLEFEVRPRN